MQREAKRSDSESATQGEIIRVPTVDHFMDTPETKEAIEAEDKRFSDLYKSGEFALPTERRQGHVFLFVGGMAAGKSTAIRSIFYDYFKRGILQRGVAFVPTKATGDYDFLPDKWVLEDFDEKKLQRYLDNLSTQRLALKKKYGKHAELPRSFLLLDDTFGTVDFYKGALSKLLVQHRHLNIWVFVTAQYLAGKGSSTSLRSWANCVFLWHSSNGQSVDAAYYAFGRYAKNDKEEKLVQDVDDFVRLTVVAKQQRYRCLLIQQPVAAEPVMSYWTASNPGKFKVVETPQRGSEPGASSGLDSSRTEHNMLMSNKPLYKGML